MNIRSKGVVGRLFLYFFLNLFLEEEYQIQGSGGEADRAIQQQPSDFSEVFSQHFFFVTAATAALVEMMY